MDSRELNVTRTLNVAGKQALAPVKILDAEIMKRIAAGEVVERPASALKELLENAIDAGSSMIKVVLIDGGLERIEVEDNGCGMTESDLRLSVVRHATSKIREIDDLDHILSLGFRGEALAALASVSRLKIQTARDGAAWELIYDGEIRFQPAAQRVGTRVVAEDLFYNVPARKKFLKRSSTESKECEDVLRRLALCTPQIAWQWHFVSAAGDVHNQAMIPAQSQLERFRSILAMDLDGVENASFLDLTADATTLARPPYRGLQSLRVLAMKPPMMSRTQKSVHLVVNGRVVFEKRLPYALREAYSGLIEVGAFPWALVLVEIDPSLIDVNIHPQKRELRWPQGFGLESLVYRLVRPEFEIGIHREQQTLGASSVFHGNSDKSTARDELGAASVEFDFAPRASSLGVSDRTMPIPFISPSTSFKYQFSPNPTRGFITQAAPFRFEQLRVIGECGASWVLAESHRGLVVIDQHAAHERINYEKIYKTFEVQSKPVLFSFALTLPRSIRWSLDELRAQLESVGFEFDASTRTELLVTAVPHGFGDIKWDKIIARACESLVGDEAITDLSVLLKKELASLRACHTSIRRGQRMSSSEIAQLFRDLDSVEWGAFCPHGRPVWWELSHEQIEKAFHRS